MPDLRCHDLTGKQQTAHHVRMLTASPNRYQSCVIKNGLLAQPRPTQPRSPGVGLLVSLQRVLKYLSLLSAIGTVNIQSCIHVHLEAISFGIES